ncbi:MAG TPA: hypothetical protein VF609_04010 [Flavisolibacter sp.]|jgi:hemolysin activation/secretion protein
MRNCVFVFVKAVMQMLVLFAGYTVMAQTPDSSLIDTTLVISSTDKPYSNIPISRSGIPFYDVINPGKEGFRPIALYSDADRFFVGVNYNRFSSGFRPDSTGSKHRLYTNYSITQRAFSLGYQGVYHRIFGRWNLFVDANYDWERWMNFYGLGNNTVQLTDDRNFYRIRSREALLSAGFQRKIGKQSSIIVTPSYQRIQLRRDDDRFLSKAITNNNQFTNFETRSFAGIRTDLLLQRLNDLILPTKGLLLSTGISHTRNIGQSRFVTNYNVYTRLYVPMGNHFVFSIENGAATLFGEPEFYQLNSLGGNNLRGFRRERFWGETMFHNNNELQYLFNAPERMFKGKLGLLAFVDQGRVWKKGEQSNEWHYGYGGGIIIAALKKVYLSLQYGMSKERKGIHMELRRTL